MHRWDWLGSFLLLVLLQPSHVLDVKNGVWEQRGLHLAGRRKPPSSLVALRGGEDRYTSPTGITFPQIFKQDLEHLKQVMRQEKTEIGFRENWILNFKSKKNISKEGLNLDTRRLFRRQLKNDSLVTELSELLSTIQGQGLNESDASDVCRVFNFPVPKSRKSYDWDHTIDCRMRLIIDFLRQRRIKKKDGTLVRLDSIFEDLFLRMEETLALRDGYLTVYGPSSTDGGNGSKSVNFPLKANVIMEEVQGLGKALVIQDKKPAKFKLSSSLIPIENSPMAPIRKVDLLLWNAIDQGSSELVERSLNQGANVSSIDWRLGYVLPIHRAVLQGDPDVLKLLVEEGANVHARTSDRVTPLHLAAEVGNVEAAKLLVKLGAEVNAVDPSFETPLHKAAAEGHVEMARELVLLGADLFLRNSWFATPSEVAESMRRSYKVPQDLNKTELAERRRNHEIISNLLRPHPLLGDEEDEAKIFGRGFLTNPNGTVLYVGNIDWSTTREEIEAHFKPSCSGLVEIVFSAPGKVGAIGVAKRQKPQHGGRVWLVFKDEVSANRALRMRGSVLKNRKLWIQKHEFTDSKAKSPSKRSLSV
mmetsp:Transcript_23345/g.75886  ORF Transcript_23345/g.75886 Transcript_23345/m.75886 type:complete len:588 (-) Transcript_23345:480-2243(-)